MARRRDSTGRLLTVAAEAAAESRPSTAAPARPLPAPSPGAAARADAWIVGRIVSPSTRLPVDRHDPVACLRSRPPRRASRLDHVAVDAGLRRPELDAEPVAAVDAMKSAAKITIASTRFAAGPAKMTATRFHVFARQYASGAEPVPDLGEPSLRRLVCQR